MKAFKNSCGCPACAAAADGYDPDELQEETIYAITKYGRRFIGILGDAENLSFTYTIDNHIHGLPELLVIGTHEGYFLNALSEMMLQRGCAFTDGELVPNGKVSVKIVNANARAREEYTIHAGWYPGTDDYAVQQVLLPDENGRFPDDPKCQKPFCTVPILRVVQ